MNDALWWTDKDGTMHEKCKLVFVSTGEVVDHDPGNHPELGWRRSSLAYFCPFCGDIWERILLQDSKGLTEWFEVVEAPCTKHPWWLPYRDRVPGSLIEGRNLEGLLELLPEQILRREFEQHLKYAEREIALDNTNTAAGMDPDGHQGTLGGPDWNGQDLRNRQFG